MAFSPFATHAQGVQNQSNTEDVVRRIRFSGNQNVKDRTLETLIRTKTNREFLGIPRFTPWYFIWKLSNGSFGEAPAYLDRQMVANDMERLSLYYRSLGYLNVAVDTTIVEYRTHKIEVSFLIEEGTASTIETISYSGMPEFDEPDTKFNFLRGGLLTGSSINDSTFYVRRQYNTQELVDEQQRIITFLKNSGYASVQRDSVIALVDSSAIPELHIQFRINPGKVFRFGDIHINLEDGITPRELSQRDTLSGEPHTIDSTNAIYLAKEPESQTNFGLLSGQVLFKPGDVYNHSLYLGTINEYQNLGMLFIERFAQSESNVQPDFTQEEIPSYFNLQTITKHTISSEFFGMKRYGYGTGFGVDYTNNNVFGNAENLSIGANTSFEYVTPSTLENILGDSTSTTQSSLFRSYELRADYSVPRLNFPFAFLDNRPSFTNAVTRYSLSYSRSDQLYFDINSDVRFNLRYEVNHTPRFSSFFDLIELDIVDTDPSRDYIANLRNEFGSDTLNDGTIVDSFELQRILEDFNPQISSIIRYTFRSQNTDLIKRNYGYFSEYSASLGGNIPYLFDKHIVTPNTLEGHLPSLFKLSENSLSYSRFFKLSADYRRYIPISNSAVFAWRLYGGYAQPYGGSTSIPLNRRFFAGGSNDIRGWAPFQLGPGTIAADNVNIPGGEIKLAAFTEARQILIRNFVGANWHGAWFTDAGNIWYGAENDFRDQNNKDRLEEGRFKFDRFYKQIAISSGLGLRLDWQYVVVRFDFAFRVHDLQNGWLNNRKLYFSFGIGHSF
ncbi:MAG: outer membrane protein assembly factor [Balneolaceae bacterium]|nr:outer membrane protein assembly factor [Balneolaceae bacterium]